MKRFKDRIKARVVFKPSHVRYVSLSREGSKIGKIIQSTISNKMIISQ